MLPDRYGVTTDYLLWRACERFGMNPFAAAMLEPARVGRLIAYEQIRQAEEAREHAAMAGARVGAGLM